MAVLKKLKASTLMETLVATILIVVVFMLSSMVLNSLLANTASHDATIKQELLLLQYQYEYGTLQLPYYDALEGWQIEVTFEEPNTQDAIHFFATHIDSQKKISFTINRE